MTRIIECMAGVLEDRNAQLSDAIRMKSYFSNSISFKSEKSRFEASRVPAGFSRFLRGETSDKTRSYARSRFIEKARLNFQENDA